MMDAVDMKRLCRKLQESEDRAKARDRIARRLASVPLDKLAEVTRWVHEQARKTGTEIVICASPWHAHEDWRGSDFVIAEYDRETKDRRVLTGQRVAS